jgi:dihydropyrimidinase
MRNAIAVHPNAVLLRGGTVLDVDGERRADLRIGRDGRVAAVEPALEPEPGETVVECAGRLLVPGGVDVHTHLHLPVGGVRVSDDFLTGTVAAAIGGTTTIVDYVTAYRGQDPMDALATWRHWAEPACID